VVVGVIVDSTPEPTANGTAVLFGRRERFDVAGQKWCANWDGGEVTVDVTAGTRRLAPPSCAPPKLNADDGDQRRRRRCRRMLQAVAAVLVPLVAVNFTFPFS